MLQAGGGQADHKEGWRGRKEGGAPVEQAGRRRQTGGNLFSPEFKLHFRAPFLFLAHSEILENEAVSATPHVKRATSE